MPDEIPILDQLQMISEVSTLHGKFDNYLLQSSHGTQQFKDYDPSYWIQNQINTSLRARVRVIFKYIMLTSNPRSDPEFSNKLSQEFIACPYVFPYGIILLKANMFNIKYCFTGSIYCSTTGEEIFTGELSPEWSASYENSSEALLTFICHKSLQPFTQIFVHFLNPPIDYKNWYLDHYDIV